MPVIGFLDGQSFDLHLMTAFRQALKDAGYIEGRNAAIYFRSADGQTDRLVTLAGDMVGRRVAVIVTSGGGAAALAAYAATTTIPIVFVTGVDPVTSGLVMSLNRPGRNATGVYIFQQVLEGKRLGLLRGLVPAAAFSWAGANDHRSPRRPCRRPGDQARPECVARKCGSHRSRSAVSQVGSRSRRRDRRFRARRGPAPARRASQVRQGCQHPRHG